MIYAAEQLKKLPAQICYLLLIVILTLLGGCIHLSSGQSSRQSFEEAGGLFSNGDYSASLERYEQIIAQHPDTTDRALFEMGILYSHANNPQRDYQKAQNCFQRIVREYPESAYRQNSEMMIFNINSAIARDGTIAAQQKLNEFLRQEVTALRQEIKEKDSENGLLKKQVVGLEQKIAAQPIRLGVADRILIEKQQHRMTLYSRGELLKTYRIALGGNPVGPKERQGDNKTPEGIYLIDSRNRESRFHLSLHISYPNEKDKKRAKALGISPGGDIMIHGIKNGSSWAGERHADVDWTQGCIAVTDEEIEEIDRVVPNGTVVEIRP